MFRTAALVLLAALALAHADMTKRADADAAVYEQRMCRPPVLWTPYSHSPLPRSERAHRRRARGRRARGVARRARARVRRALLRGLHPGGQR
jgi:hypothetical protein